ncbi:MAG: type II toxin-antitoxin system death-on-curing family toxin [Propionibacteriaceae bacterium]|nr:type II toxin-antitoxin system death-on-curing family toxin [Propionibacteriaceae bacterium]
MIHRISFDLCVELNRIEVKAGPLVAPDKLESALAAPFQVFGGVEAHPTLVEKAARLAYGIAEAQAFRDGNKRTAWLVTVVFLEMNGVKLEVDQDEAAHVIRSLGMRDDNDARLLDLHGLVDWFVRCTTGAPTPGWC